MTTSDFFQSVTAVPGQYTILVVLALVMAFAIMVYIGRHRITQSWLNFRMRSRLKRLGVKQLSNIRFPDGLGNFFVIDHLLMCRDGISMIMLKRYPGNIFCADNIDEWTQLLGGKSYHFKNPLVDLEYQVNLVSSCIPDVPVNGYLFFDYQASFPKGCPDRVIQLDNIPQELKRGKTGDVQESVQSAWDKLKTMI